MKKLLVLLFSILVSLFPSLSGAESSNNLTDVCYDLASDIILVHNNLDWVDDSVKKGTIKFDDIEEDYMRQSSINDSNASMFYNLDCKSRLSGSSIN